MTAFNKRLERLAAGLPELSQKMTFIYEDGERVEVVGFLAAVKQNTKRDGLVDVPGANEGLKNFLFCSQCDIEKLFSGEVAENGRAGEQLPSKAETASAEEGNVPTCSKRIAGAIKKHGHPIRKRKTSPLANYRRRNR